ncbi:MAG: glycosyltransferase family 4 protein, partial [Chloroflexota bacterium]|nr:glycosyltransferase family 4 protein [Chloroflexota bacterium]
AALAGVTVTGYVPDLRPYHAAARVVIAPTRVPAGNLIKIMDGLAAGRPVVATTIANRGIAAPSVRTADTPDAFATHIVTLLRDDTAWRADCAINRAYARSHFDWDANVARLETLYMDGVQRIRTEGRNVPRPSES